MGRWVPGEGAAAKSHSRVHIITQQGMVISLLLGIFDGALIFAQWSHYLGHQQSGGMGSIYNFTGGSVHTFRSVSYATPPKIITVCSVT